jgi:hypothetical protein
MSYNSVPSNNLLLLVLQIIITNRYEHTIQFCHMLVIILHATRVNPFFLKFVLDVFKTKY